MWAYVANPDGHLYLALPQRAEFDRLAGKDLNHDDSFSRHISGNKIEFKAPRNPWDADAKYRAIFNNMRDVIYRTDANGILLDMSPSGSRHLGYTMEEIIGSPVYSAL